MPSEKDELSKIKEIRNLETPAIYIRHICHLRFNELLHQHPVYINVIRDPVETFVSNYYYRRFGFNGEKASSGNKWSTQMSTSERNQTIGECIEWQQDECTKPWSNLIPFLCGSSKICLSRSAEALEIAKRRVEYDYTLVGLTEDFLNTVRALEKLVPSFFDGASEIYIGQSTQLHEHSKTSNRQGTFPKWEHS